MFDSMTVYVLVVESFLVYIMQLMIYSINEFYYKNAFEENETSHNF